MKRFGAGFVGGLVAGIIFAVVMIVYGLITKNIIAPTTINEVDWLFKDIEISQYLMLFGLNIIVGIFWGIVFSIARKGFPANWLGAGLIFGFYIWLVGRLPLLGLLLIITKIPVKILSLWGIGAFLTCIIGSLFLSITYTTIIREPKKLEPEKVEPVEKEETEADKEEKKE
ncbi:MAG: hypothetical protein B6D57_03840 [Candidatus Coatesbacteria bacterium 4484_99]|uniref:Uncharacterized protein n=1 Tax=Candidatus Coatesbacteria bacterium 4484_99 TaxID=1970774 RepID=A0A1W9S0C6_9BACT|nr:MAG: hypothetical protein B6D57_03840 [Candidatus Coatesbacteria bacterium 4484_99]